jgi:hypothetical protein
MGLEVFIADESDALKARFPRHGQFVAIPDAEATFADLARTTQAHIMAIPPPRPAAKLVSEESRMMIQAKLETAFRKALARLAKSPQ